jgi:hypothetical protein
VAPGIVEDAVPVGERTAKFGSRLKVTVAEPAASVAPDSVTKTEPFHTTTTLDVVIDDDDMMMVRGLRNVPG